MGMETKGRRGRSAREAEADRGLPLLGPRTRNEGGVRRKETEKGDTALRLQLQRNPALVALVKESGQQRRTIQHLQPGHGEARVQRPPPRLEDDLVARLVASILRPTGIRHSSTTSINPSSQRFLPRWHHGPIRSTNSSKDTTPRKWHPHPETHTLPPFPNNSLPPTLPNHNCHPCNTAIIHNNHSNNHTIHTMPQGDIRFLQLSSTILFPVLSCLNTLPRFSPMGRCTTPEYRTNLHNSILPSPTTRHFLLE